MPWRSVVRTDEARATGARRTTYDGPFDVKWYGALGIGSTGATADQAGFTAALAAAGQFGTVYVPPGNYYVTGGFNFGQCTRIVGGGLDNTTINHTGDNTFITSIFDPWVGGSVDLNYTGRVFKDFNVKGNNGASARGILEADGYHTEFRNLRFGYYGSGAAIELRIKGHWTEANILENIQVRACKYGFVLDKDAVTVSNSFGSTHFIDCTVSTGPSGSIGLKIGAGCQVYNSHIDMKINAENAGCTGLEIGAGARLEDNVYNLYIEKYQFMTAPTLITIGANARLRGRGILWPPPTAQGTDPNNNYSSLATVDRTAIVDIAGVAGDGVITHAPASDQYYHIADLPVSSGATHEKVVVELIGGPFWDSTAMAHDRVMFANRGGFGYQYQRSGRDTGDTRANFRLIAYSQGDGTVQIWAKALSGQFIRSQIRAYGVGTYYVGLHGGDDEAVSFPLKPPTTTVPSGSIVFDSGNTTTYPPNMVVDIGAVTTRGVIANVPSATQTISAVGNTILANAGNVVISNSTGGSLTLTSAPTIANGSDGQKVTLINVGTQNVVIQDQATLANSNVRTVSGGITLGTRDSVELTYYSTVGDWVQTGPLVAAL